MSDTTGALRAFILARFLPGELPANLRDTTPLQTSGILDSLALLELVSFIKDEFGVELDVYDMSAERFDSLADMDAAVRRRRAPQAQPA
jgi:acyl carrier protein